MSVSESALDARRRLLELFQAALRAVDGEACVARALRANPLVGPVVVIAIGKAGEAMLRGAMAVLGDRITQGLLISKHGYVRGTGLPPGWVIIEAGHPLPDAHSLAAGQALRTLIAQSPPNTQLLFLISGGTSSLVEVLPDRVSLDDLVRANAWLLGSGLDIGAMNRVRKALSLIKGGRLLAHLGGRTAHALLISDVPGDDPAVIGSGLLAPAPGVDRLDDLDLPDWLRALCVVSPESVQTRVDMKIVARNRDACEAVCKTAQAQGLVAHVHPEGLHGNALAMGARIAEQLKTGEAGVHVWGGESVITLPPLPGRGGRNQSLALAAAIALQGRDDVCLLAAGTDGSDGPTEDAGALVDGHSIDEGEQAGLDAGTCLQAADAGRFLEASGDLIQTGPTGTNVMDLVIGLRL